MSVCVQKRSMLHCNIEEIVANKGGSRVNWLFVCA